MIAAFGATCAFDLPNLARFLTILSVCGLPAFVFAGGMGPRAMWDMHFFDMGGGDGEILMFRHKVTRRAWSIIRMNATAMPSSCTFSPHGHTPSSAGLWNSCRAPLEQPRLDALYRGSYCADSQHQYPPTCSTPLHPLPFPFPPVLICLPLPRGNENSECRINPSRGMVATSHSVLHTAYRCLGGQD